MVSPDVVAGVLVLEVEVEAGEGLEPGFGVVVADGEGIVFVPCPTVIIVEAVALRFVASKTVKVTLYSASAAPLTAAAAANV